MKNEKDYEVVGNIRIKEKKKQKKDKKKKSDSTPFFVKAFVWFMFIAMAASFFVPLIYYLISVMGE